MPTLKIDGKEITVEPGTMVIEAVRKLGADVPHFCYHPKLSIAGNCRMCLVEVEKMPKPQISCNLPCTEGMVVHTQSENAKKWRKNVLEFILVNHPIDCPVCDQAGECKLQNYYLSESVKGSRFEEEKVHKPKKFELGPQVMLDDERCIMCSRCVRFCDEVTETHELGFIQRGDHVELRPFPGKQLDNKYSVNTVDICPVGALTSKDFRFKQRVWFLQTADSVCSGCSRGCNIKLQHNNGVVYRYLPRENEAVNEVWMCDDGRLTYKEINDDNRLLISEKKNEGKWQIMGPEATLLQISQALKEKADNTLLAIASAQASNENIFAFKKFAQSLNANATFISSGRDVANAYSDDFLIKADKNPNTFGLEKLGFKRSDIFAKARVVLVLGELSLKDQKRLADLNAELVVVFSTHKDSTSELGHWRLPVTMFAEEEGSFTNFEGRVQKFNSGLKARGQMKPAWVWLQDLSLKCGLKLEFTHAEALLKEALGVSYKDLGSTGKVI